MDSAAPPNYDPNQTMLKGGEGVPIVPVQGGGATTGFTPNQELQGALQRKVVPPELPEAQTPAETAAAYAAAATAKGAVLKVTGNNQLAVAAAGKAGEMVINKMRKPKKKRVTAEQAQDTLGSVTEEEKQVAADAAEEEAKAARAEGYDETEVQRRGTEAAVRAVEEERKATAAMPEGAVKALAEEEERKEEEAEAKAEQRLTPLGQRPAMTTRLKETIRALDASPVYLEYYSMQPIDDIFRILSEQRAAKFQSNEDMKLYLKALADDYEKYAISLWNNTALLPAGYSQVPTLPVSGAFSSLAAKQLLTTFSRLTYVLPVDTENLVVIPPVKGETYTFLKAIKTLETLGVLKMTTSTNGSAPIFEIKKGTVIVFTAPFYRPIEDDEGKSGKLNFILLSFFLDIQRTNLGKVFVLSDSTSENFSIGTYLHTVRGSPSANHTLINMLEPSYILYPYRRSTMEGILLSSTRVPEPNYPPPKSLRATTLDDLYSNRIFGKVATLVSKPNLEAGDAYSNGYFVVRSDAAAGSLSVPDEHLHAKDVCKGAPVLESNYDLTLKMQELHPDRSMQLVQAVLGTTAQPTYEDVFLVFRLLPKADYIPLCLEASAKRDPVAKEKDKFVGGPEAFTNPDIVTFVKAEVNGDIFRIRSPVEEVKADWLNELYTDEEARFLNSLNLRPVMLEAIFPSINDQPMWQKRVAGFLENIAFSKCFSDDSLMLRRECMTTRDFINKVYFYFIDNSLRADTLREFEKAKEQAASKQLLEQMDATKAQELRKSGITPDYSEAAAVGSPQDFSEHKRSWKTLDVWEDTIKKEKYAYVMMINKKTGEQEYRSVSVPAENYPDIALAQQALMNKIEDLRRKYTGHFFIY